MNKKEHGSHTGSHGVSAEASGRESVDRSRVEDGLSRDLAVVVQELEAFLDPDVIPDWLMTEQYTLGGRTPIQALRDGHLAEVLQAVNAAEHGAYI